MKSFRKGEEDEEDEGRYISCVKGKRYEKQDPEVNDAS